MIPWLLLLLQDEPTAKVDAMGTHVIFEYKVDAPHVIKWNFWETEITTFSDGTDLGTRKPGESSADSASFLLSIQNERRVELVARKPAQGDVTVEGFFDLWVASKIVEGKIERLKLEKGELLRLSDFELTLTEIHRKDGVVYLRAEFSTLTEINLDFIKELKFTTTDGIEIKSKSGGTQTTTFKSGKKDRWGHILRWELTTEEAEVAAAYKLYDKPERKRFPFKVTAPLR